MLSWFTKQKKAPNTQPSIRDVLFGDESLEKMATYAQGSTGDEPWSHFAAADQSSKQGNKKGAIAELRKVLEMDRLESRLYLQAWNCLRTLGETPPADDASEIRGAVVEVAMDKGLDLVAGYADHTARYFNYSGAGVVWDTSDPEIDRLIDNLLKVGQHIIRQIGPWDGPRPSAPPQGSVRINLLTFGGLYFGQGEFNTMSQDQLGGPAIQAAFELMQALMAKHTAKQ
jgi:hypothetical protein